MCEPTWVSKGSSIDSGTGTVFYVAVSLRAGSLRAMSFLSLSVRCYGPVNFPLIDREFSGTSSLACNTQVNWLNKIYNFASLGLSSFNGSCVLSSCGADCSINFFSALQRTLF